MTDKERRDEGAEETIEDLEAPAESQDDVAGGAPCKGASCVSPTMRCAVPTCKDTKAFCADAPATHDIVVYNR
jgi:hypothetical protein